MKKITVILVTTLAFIFSNVYCQTVYVTKGGHKYHNAGCRYLNKSSIAIELSDAIARNYTPCSVCKPSLLKTDSNLKSDTEKQNSSAQSKSQVQNNTTSSSGTTRIGCICRDGTGSYATGRGACSHHGGVDHWLYK